MDYEELKKLMDDLHEADLHLAFAESMTAGMLVKEFSKTEGASRVLKGSLVTYHPELKIQLLHVDPTTIANHTAESQQVTSEMVKGLVRLISADIAVAVTGLASAGGSESAEKPVGTVFISILYKNKLHEFRTEFNADTSKSKQECEEDVMNKTVDFVFQKIKELFNQDV